MFSRAISVKCIHIFIEILKDDFHIRLNRMQNFKVRLKFFKLILTRKPRMEGEPERVFFFTL